MAIPIGEAESGCNLCNNKECRVKKYIVLSVITILYVVFLLFQLSPADHGGHHGHGMKDLVVGHLTDHPIEPVTIKSEDLVHIRTMKSINNFIAEDVNGRLERVTIDLSGIGLPSSDMKITKWVMIMWFVSLLCLLIFIPVARTLKKSARGATRSRWVNLWEVMIGFVHDEIVEPNFDHKYVNRAMPYFLSIFFFILFSNLIGLVPGMATATGNLAVTLGLALLTLLGMVVIGSVKQGPQWIITGIVPHGIPIPLFPLLWLIEVLGLLIKPFALTVRLFANMTAGHVVIIIFLYLVMMYQSYYVGIGSVAGSLMMYLLEILVAFIQAYIFAVLSAMFIGSSMHAH